MQAVRDGNEVEAGVGADGALVALVGDGGEEAHEGVDARGEGGARRVELLDGVGVEGRVRRV